LKIWEVHRDLSLALGESVGLESYTLSNPPSFIPDGARYSKSLRDSYIYRAMLHLYNIMLREIVSLPRQAAAEIIFRLYPNVIKRAELSTSVRTETSLWLRPADLEGYSILYLLSLQAMKVQTNNIKQSYPIPIKSTHYKNALMNPRNVQRCDAFCTIYKQINGAFGAEQDLQLFIYDPNKTLWDYQDLAVTFLPYPKNPVNQELDEDLVYEESYISLVLQYATLYGMGDSQEVQAVDRFYPNTLDSSIKGGSNGSSAQ
jgi:hypothetical protein